MKLKFTITILSIIILFFSFGCKSDDSSSGTTPEIVATPKILVDGSVVAKNTTKRRPPFVRVIMVYQKLTFSCTTVGAEIYYTLDGSTPTTSSNKWDGNEIDLTSTFTVKAIAAKDGMTTSAVATYVHSK